MLTQTVWYHQHCCCCDDSNTSSVTHEDVACQRGCNTTVVSQKKAISAAKIREKANSNRHQEGKKLSNSKHHGGKSWPNHVSSDYMATWIFPRLYQKLFCIYQRSTTDLSPIALLHLQEIKMLWMRYFTIFQISGGLHDPRSWHIQSSVLKTGDRELALFHCLLKTSFSCTKWLHQLPAWLGAESSEKNALLACNALEFEWRGRTMQPVHLEENFQIIRSSHLPTAARSPLNHLS